MNKNIIVGVSALILIVGGGSFYGGMKYARVNGPQNMNVAVNGQFRGMAGTGGRMGQMTGAATMGQIISKDDTSITIKLPDGGSKIVFFSQSTSVIKTATSSIASLGTNDNVTVSGSTNTDGSITAQTIQVGSFPFGFRTAQTPASAN